MSLDLDEDFWEDLLAHIKEGKVIPVIGQGMVTYGAEDEPLYPWLAKRLAERLSLPWAKMEQPLSLNRVATAFLLQGKDQSNLLYTRFFRILRDECPEPGSLLRSLAQIDSFDLFLSTTVDPLLAQALNRERYGGAPQTASISFSEGLDRKDLPVRKRDLQGSLVYHLFGQASSQQEYVLWEADVLETVIDLHDHLKRTGTVDRLSLDLQEHGLLLLGLTFSDWLVRLFLRITRQEKLSLRVPPTPTYLADDPGEVAAGELVMFFRAATRGVHVVRCCPKEFTRELVRRWLKKYPPESGALPPAAPLPVAAEMPKGAIFISYAREDEASVRRLVAGLQQAGCDVWYDRERLKPGAYWPDELEKEVKKRCSLFLSVISKTTERSHESYYNRERNWAAHRFAGFKQNAAAEFYIPVIIDDTPFSFGGEPGVFSVVQATRLLDGVVTSAFGEHLEKLQRIRKAQIADL